MLWATRMNVSLQKSLWTAAVTLVFSLALALGCGQPQAWRVVGPDELPASADNGGISPEEGLQARPRIQPSTGRLVVNLVDAPKPEVTSIFVTIDHVDAVTAGGTVTVMSTPVTVDLLTLQNGAFLQLGAAALPAGEISQLRLLLAPGAGHHVVMADGSTSPLKIPSGDQTGIKLNGPFQISACSETTLTVDFDGEKSVNVHPAGPQHSFILRPVIFVKQVETAEVGCEEEVDAGTTDETDAGTTDEIDAGTTDETDESDAGTGEPIN